MNPIVNARGKVNYNKFEQPVVSQRLPGVGIWGITETIQYVKDNVYINCQFDGQEIAGNTTNSEGFRKGYRAIGNGAGDSPEWRWLHWITGYVGGFTTNAAVSNPEFRAIAYGEGVTAGNPNYNNYTWDRWTVETSIAEWYKWGARKFWMHQPFGKISRNRSIATDANGYLPFQNLPNRTIHLNAPHQEALHYQPDQYLCAKEGCTCPLTGQFGNAPMPWLTDDFVDGKTQGFVPLFKALITGTAGDLPTDVWERLTGIGGPSAWFNPNEPIEVVVYNGAMNGETFRKWRRWCDRGNATMPQQTLLVDDGAGDFVTPLNAGWGGNIGGPIETNGLPAIEYARKRWRDSVEPFARAGMRIGLDALVAAPGPIIGVNQFYLPDKTFDGFDYVPGINEPAGKSYGNTLDAEWWKFFSEHIMPTFKPNNIFCEAYPFTVPIKNASGAITGWTANAYSKIGINMASGDEFFRAAFGTNSPTDPPGVATKERAHYLEEFGQVEIVRSALQWGLPGHVGYFDPTDGKTYANGRFWYLLPWASRQQGQFSDGSAQGSALHPFIDASKFAQGYRYLRIDGEDVSSGYGYGPLLADVVALDFLSRYQVQKQDFEQGQGNKGDPTSILRDKTIPKTFIANLAKRRLLPGTSRTVQHPNGSNVSVPVLGRDTPGGQGFVVISGVTFFPTSGLTNDFNGKYPTIREFANTLVPILTGTQTLDPRKINFGAPQTIIDSGKLVQEIADTTSKMNRVEKIHGVMWLDIAAYDAFAGTNLYGISGGQFYVPTIEKDIPVNRLHHWLDIELLNWKRRYGFMPKYIAWNLTELGFSGVCAANGEPLGFEMERYLFIPKTIPNYNNVRDLGENFNGYRDTIDNRRHLYWGVQEPGITWDASIGSERLVNKGYDIGYEREFQQNRFETVPPDPLYTASKDLVVDLVKKTKYWRDTRGLSGTSKVTVYHVPYLPPYALPVPRIQGNREAAVVVTSNAGVWNDTVFPQGATVDNPQAAQSGVVGWYTPEETEQIKRSIKLEYRKRYEPIVKEIEALFPEDYDRGRYHLPSDTFTDPWISTKKETLNVSNDFKTKNFWSTTDASDLGTVWSGEIHPLINQTHIGGDNEVLNEGDPKSQKDGNLFDYNSYYHRLIDWVRDDYLRPKYVGLTATVQGMSMWDSAHYQIFNAIRTGSSSYTGITADRDRMLRWLKAEYGNGATIDWGNSADVDLKTRQYFSVIFNLNRKMLNRFRSGIPRVDVVDPYSHVPFAASWSIGYGRSSGYTLGHPKQIGSLPITDVVPMIFAGESADRPWGALLRYEVGNGYTGNIPGGNFTNIIHQFNNVPKGKRVLLPYYWHQDPISDQFSNSEYYKMTTDGSTYTGFLAYRSHETAGQVRFQSPWAFAQMKDAKDSISNFLQAMYATGGKIFDYVADDAESWGVHSLGGGLNVYEGAFGPTGMPAGTTVDPGVPGSHIERFPTWKIMPDTRVTRTLVYDPRFTAITNGYNGLSYSANIQTNYRVIAQNGQNAIYTPTFVPTTTSINGVTAAQILEYYIKEGANAISACTGPAYASQYGPPYNNFTSYDPTTAGASAAKNPWRTPFGGNQLYNLTDASGFRVNRYMAWLAFDLAMKDFAFSSLKKPMWVDTIEGFTSPELRGTAYSHYGLNSTGITDGMLVPESYGHPRIGNSYHGIDVAPEIYGSMFGSMPVVGYYPNPTTDRQRYNVEPNTSIAGVCAFFGGNTSAKSYIATVRELASVRAMQRFNPNYWRSYCPWVSNPYVLEFWNGYRADQTNVSTVSDRTEPKYWEELIRQLLVSGSDHFNYFHTLLPSQNGYTAGLTAMQNLINEWKVLTDGKRVQPISPDNGNPITLSNKPEMIRMGSVGGNHEGATGVMVNGCRILEKNMSSKIPLPAYGGIDREERLWRITAAPQAKILRKVGTPSSVVFTGTSYEYGSQDSSPEGYNLDLPQEVNLETGEIAYYKVRTDGRDRGGFSETWSGWEEPGLPSLVPGGKISYLQNFCALSTEKSNGQPGNPNSRAELRLSGNHTAQTDGSAQPITSPIWANDSQWSEQVGTFLVKNRPTSLKGRVRVSSEGTLSPGYPFVGATGTLCVFGYYRLHNANSAFTGGAQPNDRFGLESAIMFYSDGTTGTWKIMVYRTKDPQDANGFLIEEITHDFDTGLPNNIERELYVLVNEERTQAKFFVDGSLVYTANGKLPVGLEWEASPIHCGCAVRDVSIKPPTGSQTGSTSPGVIEIRNMEFTVHAGSKDKVYVTPGDRGFWIKRTGIPVPPSYSMYDQPIDKKINLIFSQINGTSGFATLQCLSNAGGAAFGETTCTINGINRKVDIQFEFEAEPPGVYPSLGFLQILKNGVSVGNINAQAAQPHSPITFSVSNRDFIQVSMTSVFGSANFLVTLKNLSDGGAVVTSFRCINTSN